VVVTSPIGLKAPPALEEIITNPHTNHFVFLSATNLFKIVTITIVVVRLSKMAERKKVNKAINQIN
jgi:hypothetical protein